jgi:anti-sigma regulatory factor (Ser/Thr protein kinase)
MAAKLTLDSAQQSLPIRDPGDPAEARRTATRLADRAGLDETDSSNLAIIATELSTNLLKHAGQGEILVRPITGDGVLGIELMALDRGPGIANLTQCFRDGYSSAGSCGNGLGAISRLASEFDICSVPDGGTAVLARLWPRQQKIDSNRGTQIGVVSIAKSGEEVCGDGWKFELLADKGLCLVVDGLGHGVNAAIAARQAMESFSEHRGKAPAEIIERVHDALRSTRGAAVAVAQVDYGQRVVRFCGVGNIVAAIIRNGDARQLASLNGTAGVEVRKISEFTYPWSDESTLIMHSDGLMSRWDLKSYPGLAQRHPSLIAGVLYRDYNRGRDDVTVLVARAAKSVAGRDFSWLTQ